MNLLTQCTCWNTYNTRPAKPLPMEGTIFFKYSSVKRTSHYTIPKFEIFKKYIQYPFFKGFTLKLTQFLRTGFQDREYSFGFYEFFWGRMFLSRFVSKSKCDTLPFFFGIFTSFEVKNVARFFVKSIELYQLLQL